MKHGKILKVLSMLLAVSIVFSACGSGAAAEKPEENPDQGLVQEFPEKEPLVTTLSHTDATEAGSYNEGVVLVKVAGEMTQALLDQTGCVSAQRLFEGSQWYLLELPAGADTAQKVAELRQLGCFEAVDYDYIMKTDAVDVSCNPDHDKEKHHDTHKIPEGWEHMDGENLNPGGSHDVIIAVIDTGVDYKHLDLRNNIWTNPAEIPDNGKDDDGNGYVDDVYGWNCVGNNNDPMDDNGHGTHVAGIIAAENNDVGGVGIAYNCRIMVIKAGNSSGYFNNSDIAEAVQYAYMNGASVINMSFGGSFISLAVEEALENAYNTSVLVAAAGNDSLCNNLDCQLCDFRGVCYPAALPYVIGVMSANPAGDQVSAFSNYDHYPHDTVEYEVYAVGEAIHSCWPDNKYASLNGTSMAAPTVSAIAALLRSKYPDRNVYSAKYIQSQIVNTGTGNPFNALLEATDDAHSLANVYEALTRIPTPAVNLHEYRLDDSTSISAGNNGNGIIDAGETVRLYVSLMNWGGVASNVNVSIDTLRSEGMSDPYFTFTKDQVTLSDIGTYSIRDAGSSQYFEIVVDPDCPNDYLATFNIRFTYRNGMNNADAKTYQDDGRQQATFNVSSGYHLPSVISEDTVYEADRLYIIGENVLIPTGVTVTFREGCRIQFYDDRTYYDSPVLKVYGTLNLEGSKEKMISLSPSERFANDACILYNYGTTKLDYVDAINLFAANMNKENTSLSVSNSRLRHSGERVYCYNDAKLENSHTISSGVMENVSYTNNELLITSYATDLRASTMDRNYIVIASSNTCVLDVKDFTNNIVHSIVLGNTKVSDRMNQLTGQVSNNRFLTENDGNPAALMGLEFGENSTVSGNYFSPGYLTYADQIISGYYDAGGNPTVDITTDCTDTSILWPYIQKVQLFNQAGESVSTIGREEITVRVTFNRPMDTLCNTTMSFGVKAPYADYRIEGSYTSSTVWEGKYTLRAQIENGRNYLLLNNAWASEDATKGVLGEYQLHTFTIDTTAAMAMNLRATATDGGILLTWNQDDYDTLMGYNIYRSTSKDGNYVKINPAVLLATEESFLDDNAEPGKTYWYTFTVVLSDFTESAPAGKVSCAAVDALAPSIYHTPVNQGYLSNNLVISCTASDNMKITSVTLYYRQTGSDTWLSLPMSRVNDKFSATIFGSELTLAGLEYYIEAFDGTNTVSKGNADLPYTVVIKDASAISRKGDVDGDGTVTVKDALMIMQAIEGQLILTDDQFRRADLNGSTELDSVEALRILQYVNGKVTELDMTE